MTAHASDRSIVNRRDDCRPHSARCLGLQEPIPSLCFDRFYRYAELTEILQSFVSEHPQLVAVESIGKSHEGRDIWLATVTNRETGQALDKPAFWVDGNIHSTEVAASVANLYFLNE